MKKFITVAIILTFGLIMMVEFAFAQQDKKGCKEHPLFTRMSNFYISSCETKDYDEVEFWEPPQGQKTLKVGGKKYSFEYSAKKEIEGKTTDIQVRRNYANAAKQIGAVVYENTSNNNVHMKIVKDGKEIWVWLQPYGANRYYLTIVEKEAMKQEVTANAKLMAEGISSTGHVAIYGIYFDFNKSDVKPESGSALQEINKLLSGNLNLKVFIVGHTDNVGGVDFNMKLSQARADNVVKVLTTKYKINPQRLKAYGVGQLAPVATNKTEEGRAKNRRVELVEQ